MDLFRPTSVIFRTNEVRCLKVNYDFGGNSKYFCVTAVLFRGVYKNANLFQRGIDGVDAVVPLWMVYAFTSSVFTLGR